MGDLKTYRRRDLSLIEIGEIAFVIATDSCGGVGEKENDALSLPNNLVGAYGVRVPLLEVLASGARPIAVVDTVSNEMEPTGRAIIEGISGELQAAGIAGTLLNGSTEENFKTSMTALGVTVIGQVNVGDLKFRALGVGDRIVLVGTPLVGTEVIQNPELLADYDTIIALSKNENVLEIVPVGSGGILKEASGLAALSGLSFETGDSGVDLNKSGGPSSCVIAGVNAGFVVPEGMVVVGKIV